MVEEGAYGWSYAETIADNMKLLFDSAHVTLADKAAALRIAMQAAVLQNRYAAMDTCQSMITSIVDEGLGLRVRDIILEFPQTFVVSIDPADARLQ
jgi:hypothetical protein